VPSPVRARSMQLPGPKHDQSPLTNDWKCFRGPWTPRRHSMATLQKRLRMCTYMERHFSLILGPDVKKYSICLKCSCLLQNVGIGEVWRLRYMQLGIEKSVYVLYLSIDAPALMLDTVLNFSQQSILD
jgi:hypothetical protein